MINRVLTNFKSNYKKAILEFNYLRRKAYPTFVHKEKDRLENEIPMFFFHSVSAIDLEEKFNYLVKNGYRTLKADELYESLTSNKVVPNTIALTFDDGDESLWSVAYPLLKKYGLTAIAFIVPNWIVDSVEYHPNLEDYSKGKISLQDVQKRKFNSHPFISWQEVKEMHNSGCIEFQSHSFSHSLIFTSGDIVDFVHPNFDFGFYFGKVPLFYTNQNNLEVKPQLGTPIYTISPRLFGAKRYFDNQNLREACINCVKGNGGADFFKDKNWRNTLSKIVNENKPKDLLNGNYESDEEREAGILFELTKSKQIIEEHLEGKTVRHLCYPDYAGSVLSIELSKKAGYMSNFWGWDVSSLKDKKKYASDPYFVGYKKPFWGWECIQGKPTNRPGDDPYSIVRLPGDYIFRLPGEERRSISRIMIKKILRKK